MSVVVLMYSKYSKRCESILQLMNPVMDFRKICIDHDEVRKLVLKDEKKYQVQTVPCILVFYSSGVMNKYEGNDAFRWVSETIGRMQTISAPPPSPAPSSVVSSVVSSVAPPPASPPLESYPVSENITGGGSVPSRAPGESIPVMPAMPFSSIPVQPVLEEKPVLPPKQEKINEEVPQTMRGVKSDKQENLLSVAQQMQKQREMEDETRNPNPAAGGGVMQKS
jgi:hypothetical protein